MPRWFLPTLQVLEVSDSEASEAEHSQAEEATDLVKL